MQKREVLKLLGALKKRYSPKKMILFGSFARGDIHELSDIDVIIIKDTDKRFTDRIGDVLELYDGDIPMDPFVYTPEEFERLKKTNSMMRRALEEGVAI